MIYTDITNQIESLTINGVTIDKFTAKHDESNAVINIFVDMPKTSRLEALANPINNIIKGQESLEKIQRPKFPENIISKGEG